MIVTHVWFFVKGKKEKSMRLSKLHTHLPSLNLMEKWYPTLPAPLPINGIGLGVFPARHDFFPGPFLARRARAHAAATLRPPLQTRVLRDRHLPGLKSRAGVSLLKCGVILEAAELRTIFVFFPRKKSMSKLARKTAACKTNIAAAAAGASRKKEGNRFRANFRPVNLLPESLNKI